MRLVLASASPARRALLVAAGVDPLVMVSSVDEDAVIMEGALTEPAAVAGALSRAKADDVWPRAVALHGPDVLVLGCDSVLDLDGDALGKPEDADDAIARWQRMRGRTGVLITGHALRGPHTTAHAVARTTVHFGYPDDDEIAAYVATGEPLAVAGAFTLDGRSAPFIEGIEGDPSNVIGLSLPLLRTLVKSQGFEWTDLWDTSGSRTT